MPPFGTDSVRTRRSVPAADEGFLGVDVLRRRFGAGVSGATGFSA